MNKHPLQTKYKRQVYTSPQATKVNQIISTGSNCIDKCLSGGIQPETIALVYGEPETGKTTLAIQCAANCALLNLKTLFIDCDNTFYAKRLSQVSKGNFERIAEQIILMRPKDFAEQTVVVDHLADYLNKNFGLVVFDTFTSLYRARVADAPKNTFAINRELNRQMAILAQTARAQHIPMVITSQVKSLINEPVVSIAPVANRVLQFWADTVIALKPTENTSCIKATLEKHQNTQEHTCDLRIAQSGICDNEL